jgi:chromosomal replication initiator protein
MLTKNQEDLWSDFLAHVGENTSLAEFQNWLAPIRVAESSSEELVLKVPNIFVQEYLLQNYKKVLAQFIPVKTDGELALRFIISAEEKAAAPLVAAPPPDTLKLNPHYTFENFIEGPSNQFVKSASQGVAAHPGKSYNPLFIHGGVGLGKTHLLHAIGHFVRSHHRKLKIHSITTEGFINEIVDNLKGKSMDRMKRFYRSLDLLLVDDIQFLQNRLNFEDEFCNTFESLLNQNKQIVITSDKPPSQLKLSERLVARMEWGLVAHVTTPDLETRVAILQHKAQLRGIRLPHNIAFFIAEHIFNNVRQLEGAINRLSAYSSLIGKEVTEEAVEKSLGELISHPASKKISVDHILRCVSTLSEVSITDLKGSSRTKNVALYRQVAMYLAKELVTESLSKLASAFGGKTHSTLLHAWKKIKGQLQSDEALRHQIEVARRNLEK